MARIIARDIAPCGTLCTAVGLRCSGADALRSRSSDAPMQLNTSNAPFGSCAYVNSSEVSTWLNGASHGRTEKDPFVRPRFFPEDFGAPCCAASSSGVGPSTCRSHEGFKPAGSIRGQSRQCSNTRSGSLSARIKVS